MGLKFQNEEMKRCDNHNCTGYDPGEENHCKHNITEGIKYCKLSYEDKLIESSQSLDCCINSEIGHTMKRLRQLDGRTQDYISKHMKISKSYLCEIEKGKKNIDIKIIKEFSKIFGIDLSDFFLIHDFLKNEAADGLVKLLVHDRKTKY